MRAFCKSSIIFYNSCKFLILLLMSFPFQDMSSQHTVAKFSPWQNKTPSIVLTQWQSYSLRKLSVLFPRQTRVEKIHFMMFDVSFHSTLSMKKSMSSSGSGLSSWPSSLERLFSIDLSPYLYYQFESTYYGQRSPSRIKKILTGFHKSAKLEIGLFSINWEITLTHLCIKK